MSLRPFRIALACAVLALAAPSSALAAPDRSTTLDATNKTFSWDAPAETSLGGPLLWSNDDPEGSCAQDVTLYCDRTWLKVAVPGDIAASLPDGGDGATHDWDLYLYEADDAGNPTRMIQESFNIGAPEAVGLAEAPAGNYVVLILYYNSLGISGPSGTVAFEPTAGGTPVPAAPGGSGTPPSSGTPPTASPAANAAPTSKISAVARSARASKLKSFKGTASDDSRVARVQISLTRKKGSKCQSMTASGGFKTTPRKGSRCVPTTFVKAKGTTRWSYKLRKRLAKGSYTLYSRAIDDTGQAQAGFNSSNTKSFKVR